MHGDEYVFSYLPVEVGLIGYSFYFGGYEKGIRAGGNQVPGSKPLESLAANGLGRGALFIIAR